jgi:aminobenzoyl-glutamate transport protein
VSAIHPPPATVGAKTVMQRLLDTVERVGNRVPHPVMIFVYLIALVVVLSALLAAFGARVTYQAYNAATGDMSRRRRRRAAC